MLAEHPARRVQPEWTLYPPILDHWRERGFRVASQLTDPRARRIELDVVAFSLDLEDVRITEAKLTASGKLIEQCLDRLRLAPRVYAAVPRAEAARLAEQATGNLPGKLGLLAVDRDGVELLREAGVVEARLEQGRVNMLARALRTELAEGRA